jgi:hypothetical protein
MKYILFFMLIIHGLIHLLGFVKAFHLANMGEFSTDISKPAGLVWFLSVLLFLLVSILLLLQKDWVWIPALAAVITSQTLIFLTWQDAKFGSIPNLIILIFVIFSFAAWQFNGHIEKETESLLSQVNPVDADVITEEMTASLPAPVQRWMGNIGIIGMKPIHTAYFEQRARMKLKPDQAEWYPAEVVQYVTMDRPGFLWKVNMKMFSALNVAGRDRFQDGQGSMTIKIGSLIPVVNAANDRKTNQSTLQRYLMELVWYPTAVFSPYITWEEIDENTAKATMTYNGVSGSATFYFDDSGNLLKVSAFRYKSSDENAVKAECIGETKEIRVVDGIKIPTKVNITWVLEDGLFTWYETEILKAKYNRQ